MSISTGDLREAIREVMREMQQGGGSKENHVEHVLSCPGCFEDTIKQLKAMSEVECENCKLPMGKKEFAAKIPSCPFCGGKKARPIER